MKTKLKLNKREKLELIEQVKTSEDLEEELKGKVISSLNSTTPLAFYPYLLAAHYVIACLTNDLGLYAEDESTIEFIETIEKKLLKAITSLNK